MNATTELILARARDPEWLRAAVARARALTGGPNACAATLSQLLIAAGLIEQARTWTADLVGTEQHTSTLEELAAMRRILHPAGTAAGDICASRDRPDDGNEAPDHVFILVSDPEGADPNNPFALVADNYCRSGRPYWRNLGKSGWHRGAWRGKTPLAYALRFVDPDETNHGARKHRQQIVDQLRRIYQAAGRAGLSQQTAYHLNMLRWSPELRDYKPQ